MLRGERMPSRAFNVNATSVRELRESLGLSQSPFASIIHVSIKTLRN